MSKNDRIQDLLLDGETLLNRWTGLEKLMNVRFFVSASNFLYAKVLLAKTLELLADKKKHFKEYMSDYRNIINLLENKEINDALANFLNDENTYMTNITLSEEQQMHMTIYKGFQLDKEEGIDIAPIIEEFIAYGIFREEQGDEITVYSMSNEIIEFNKDFNLGLDIKDARKK